MMEMAKDLNMESDEMQLVVSALRGVGKRIAEVPGTHKPRPLQNLTPSSIILVFEHYWLTRSQYF